MLQMLEPECKQPAPPPLRASAPHANQTAAAAPAVYVHWGSFTTALRNAILLTLSWGTDVWLLSDFAVRERIVAPRGRAVTS